MLPDRVSNPGPLTYESGALPIALRGPAIGPVVSEKSYLKLGTDIGWSLPTLKPPFESLAQVS